MLKQVLIKMTLAIELMNQLLGKNLLTTVQVWDDQYLSVKEVAARLGYSVRQIQRWMEAGAISYIQIGSTRFFSVQYLIAFLKVKF
jgi:excisionase family DNA binding protein